MNKIQNIKEITTKIDIGKISSYLADNPKSTSLKEIIKYSKRVLDSNDEKQTIKLGKALAYDLDTICDENKAGYVKDEEEKKFWLGISQELFENTIGLKDKI